LRADPAEKFLRAGVRRVQSQRAPAAIQRARRIALQRGDECQVVLQRGDIGPAFLGGQQHQARIVQPALLRQERAQIQ